MTDIEIKETDMTDNVKYCCENCIANRFSFHGCLNKEHTCTRCSMYYRDPKSFFGYLKYFKHRIVNRLIGFKFRIREFLCLFKFEYLGKRIPSCIKRGDIIEWAYDNELEKFFAHNDENKDIHTITHKQKVDRVWVEYDENAHEFFVMARLFCEGGGTEESAFNSLMGRFNSLDGFKKTIVSINGKRKLRYTGYYHVWDSTYRYGII